MEKINKFMFREYDIRGQVDADMTEPAVFSIGRGFATFLLRRNITKAVVGYDGREYSPRLEKIFVDALLKSGIDVISIGLVLTPILYFSQYFLKQKGAVMITASHNPNGWTGFKLGYDYSTTLGPQEIEELYAIVEAGQFVEGQGTHTHHPTIIEEYKKDVLSRVRLERPMHIVIDAGNGTAGPIAPAIFRAAGCEVTEQCCTLDWNFSNHEPNPSTLEAIEHLGSKVRAVGATVGLGFDGDGDRLGLVDENGGVVWTDQALILLSRLALKHHPGSPIVFDVKCTAALPEDIKAQGGVPIMWKTGHSYIKQKGKEVGAAIAGERSGHIFFYDGYYGYDDGIFAGLKLLEYISGQEKSVSQLIADTPQYVRTPYYHVPCADEVKYDVVNGLVQEFKEEYGSERVIDINGARVLFPDGWGLVRASSNIPVIGVTFEAQTEEALRRIEGIFRSKLDRIPEVGKEWETG